VYVLIVHNSQPRKVTSTLQKGTLGAVTSLLVTTLYQRNPDRNYKLWNIVSSERYILREEGLYYHPITVPVVITLDEEEWMHCHHFKGQFVNYTSTL
jgi:hypothetical protein